jgi:hypothetical protein
MEHIHNNLMKLGGSLGNVPQKNEKLVLLIYSMDCTLENGLAVRNISSFYKKFFIFLWNVVTLLISLNVKSGVTVKIKFIVFVTVFNSSFLFLIVHTGLLFPK